MLNETPLVLLGSVCRACVWGLGRFGWMGEIVCWGGGRVEVVIE